MITSKTGWGAVFFFLRERRRFLGVVACVLVFELCCSAILPRFIPDHWYLRLYLPWRSVMQTERFLAGQLDIEPDPECGWHNRGNAVYSRIRYDKYGSRSFNGISETQRKALRVFFFGDSRVNGYTVVENHETINARLESETVETLNFATAFYGLDQMYLAFRKSALKFRPDAAIIGIGSETEHLLDSNYIPFILRKEYGMPFLKPRFEVTDDGIALHTPDIRNFLADVPNSPEMLDFLKKHDGYYADFQTFKRWRSTPLLAITSLIGKLFSEIILSKIPSKNTSSQGFQLKNPDILRGLIREIKGFSDQQQIRVCLLLFPSLQEFQSPIATGRYAAVARLIRAEKIDFIDVRQVFRSYRGNERLYTDDTHVTPAATRLIADTIRHSVLEKNDGRSLIVR